MSRVLTALLTGALLVGCGGDTLGPTPAAKPCDGLLKDADPAAALPPGIPALDGQVLYGPGRQGKTSVVLARAAGTFVDVRDQLVVQLKESGWTIESTDQESVEAEAQFSRQPPLRSGSVKVEPLCAGMVEVRYRLSE